MLVEPADLNLMLVIAPLLVEVFVVLEPQVIVRAGFACVANHFVANVFAAMLDHSPT